MSLAIFDLDNTLLGGDSDHSWGTFLVEQNLVNAQSYEEKNNAFYQDYQTGNLDILAYQRFALAPIKGKTPEELAELHRKFMDTTIAELLLPKAEKLINDHKSAGDDLLIITATNRFITAPIAQRLNL